jgi:hypothetical protein
MDGIRYFFNVSLAQYGEVNATIPEVAEDPRVFFQVSMARTYSICFQATDMSKGW